MKQAAAKAIVGFVYLVVVWWTGFLLRGARSGPGDIPGDVAVGASAVGLTWLVNWAFREVGSVPRKP